MTLTSHVTLLTSSKAFLQTLGSKGGSEDTIDEMGKLRYGPAISLVKCSHGPEVNNLHFYSTSYSTSYGKEGFLPRPAKPRGTGYLANFRPGVYYSSSLDKHDNPAVGRMLRNNYLSTYSQQHRPYLSGPDGKDDFPYKVKTCDTAFNFQAAPISIPYSSTVLKARLDTLEDRKYKPLLKKLQGKSVPHLDQGSLSLSTEARTCYKGEPSCRMNLHLKDVGAMEPSGFTHYHHYDPIQYLPRAPHGGEISERLTEVSEKQNKFVKWPILNGREENSGVCKRAQRETGYSHETARPRFVKRVPRDAFTFLNQAPSLMAKRIEKHDPAEFVNMIRGPDNSTLSSSWYQGRQASRDDVKNMDSVGCKESTGFTTNNGRYVCRKIDKGHFDTHYTLKYGEKFRGAIYQGRSEALATKPTDGFTKSTLVHFYGNGRKFRERDYELRHALPGKVIKVEHPCYTDNTINYKIRPSVTVP